VNEPIVTFEPSREEALIRMEQERSEHRGRPALIPDDLDMFVTTTRWPS